MLDARPWLTCPVDPAIFTDLVRRQLKGPGGGPRRARVSSAHPSSRHTGHYAISRGQGCVAHSSSSLTSRFRRRPRLQPAREALALSLPPNPEDAPLLRYRLLLSLRLLIPRTKAAAATPAAVVGFFPRSLFHESDPTRVVSWSSTTRTNERGRTFARTCGSARFPYSHEPPYRVRRLNVATSSGRDRQLRELSIECCARFDVTRHSGGALGGGAPIR